MTMSMPCPKCDAALRLPDHAAGKKVRCTQCNQAFVVPAEEEAPLVEPIDDTIAEPNQLPPRVIPVPTSKPPAGRSRPPEPQRSRSGMPVLLIVGGVALVGLFFLVVCGGVGVWAYWRHHSSQAVAGNTMRDVPATAPDYFRQGGRTVEAAKDKVVRPPAPDLIVANLTAEGDSLLLEVQNQGPGRAPEKTTVVARISFSHQGKVVPVSEQIPVPVAEFERALLRIRLDRFGVRDARQISGMVSVTLDPDNQIAEERENNNDYHKHWSVDAGPNLGNRGGAAGLPDLVITDITLEGASVIVHYKNQGQGSTGADFLIRVGSGNRSFNGNHYYRFVVPPPGEIARTGGINAGAVGIAGGRDMAVTATIDHEDRVRESNETNNDFTKTLRLGR